MTDNARLFGVAGVPSPRHAFKWIPREPRRTASLSRTGCGSAQPKWNQVPRDVRGRSREANKPSTRRTCRRGRPEVVGEWSHEPIVPPGQSHPGGDEDRHLRLPRLQAYRCAQPAREVHGPCQDDEGAPTTFLQRRRRMVLST